MVEFKAKHNLPSTHTGLSGFLTLRRPNFIGTNVPVAPDLAKTVKMGSDHSQNSTNVFYGAKNEKLSFKILFIHEKFYKINFFFFLFVA